MQCLAVNEMNHFPNENEIIFIFLMNKIKTSYSKNSHQFKLKKNYLRTQWK